VQIRTVAVGPDGIVNTQLLDDIATHFRGWWPTEGSSRNVSVRCTCLPWATNLENEWLCRRGAEYSQFHPDPQRPSGSARVSPPGCEVPSELCGRHVVQTIAQEKNDSIAGLVRRRRERLWASLVVQSPVYAPMNRGAVVRGGKAVTVVV